MYKLHQAVAIFALFFLCVGHASADKLYFNAKEIIHIQDSCTSDKIARCTNVAHYTYTHFATGKTYTGIAIRVSLPESDEGYDYAYMDDKEQIHMIDELSSEPLHAVSDYSFADYLYRDVGYGSGEAFNTTKLRFRVARGFDDQELITIYRDNSRLNGCGDVLSFNLETGEVFGDAILFTQVCTFPNMNLQQAYAAYRKILVQGDGRLFYARLRATFPEENVMEDEFSDPESYVVINYSHPTPDNGKIEMGEECGDTEITLEESEKGTQIVHYDYGC